MYNIAGSIAEGVTPESGIVYFVSLGVFLLIWGAIVIALLIGAIYWYRFLKKIFSDLNQTPKGRKYIKHSLSTTPLTMIVFGYAFYNRNHDNPVYLLWTPFLGAAVHLIVTGVILKLLNNKVSNKDR